MSLRQYVILPPHGLRPEVTDSTTSRFLRTLEDAEAAAPLSSHVLKTVPIQLLDSVSENGAKLVEMTEEDAQKLQAREPNIRVCPVKYYELAWAPRPQVVARAVPLSRGFDLTAPTIIELRVVDHATHEPVPGCHVVVFTNFPRRFGDQGITDAQGAVSISLGNDSVRLDRLYIYPPLAGYWGLYKTDVTIRNGESFGIQAVEIPYNDCVRHFHTAGMPSDGQGVKVGIIDTGCGPHPDLNVSGDTDNGDGHGTHVAGIIGATGKLPGIAPGATLVGYRVFSSGSMAASFSIAKAIDQAVLDGCDLINLSLKIGDGQDAFDPVVQAALEDARAQGCLPVAAAGNDARAAVTFPAKDPTCLAVGACGRRQTWPADSLPAQDVAAPTGADSADYVASFSNEGPEISLLGPGSGVVSTVPGGYGIMSGTSMACPAVVGMIARRLAKEPGILAMQRDAERAAAIAGLAGEALLDLGFPASLQGQGLMT